MKTIFVKFAGMSSQTYAYLTDIEGIGVGDTLVVDSPNSGFTCMTVTSVEETAESVGKATKWVVSKVDVAGYKERLERAERRKLLTAKLKEMQAEALEADQFAALIKLVPGAAALVDELKSLS
jgi:dihydroxyacetone kinase